MAKMTETELRIKLRKGGSGTSSGTSGPTAVKVGSDWEYSEEVLYLSYASGITSATDGIISNQSDASGFQLTPFNVAGTLMPWRGSMFTKSMYQSGDATDYLWENISSSAGAASFLRYYTYSSEIESNIGNPDTPGVGVAWVGISPSVAIPGAAFWVAEQYTMNGIESAWVVKKYKTKSAGFGLVAWTKSPVGAMPALNSTAWNTDTLLATGAFTGETYNNITELGYGTAVVITYSDGKLQGLLKNVSGVATWVSAPNFIEGDLLVDGTINSDQITTNAIVASKIATNAITATKIVSSAITADKIASGAVTSTKVSLVPSDVGAGAAGTSGERLVISSNRIDIYDASNNLRIRLGEL